MTSDLITTNTIENRIFTIFPAEFMFKLNNNEFWELVAICDQL